MIFPQCTDETVTLLWNLLNLCFLLQRKRHRIALKKKRAINRREQAADYARLLAVRTKEAKVKRAEEVKRRRSRSASKSSVGTQ